MTSPTPPKGFELSPEWWETAPPKDMNWFLYALGVIEKPKAKQDAALRKFRDGDPRWEHVPAAYKEAVNGRLA